MPRIVWVLVGAAAALAATAGVLVGAGVLLKNGESAFPAPARIPQVVGLTEKRAVHALEAERLQVSVEHRRARGASRGRVIAQAYGGAKRIGALMMGFRGQTVRLIVAR